MLIGRGRTAVIKKVERDYKIIFLKKVYIFNQGFQFNKINSDFFFNHVIEDYGSGMFREDYIIYTIKNNILYPCLSYIKERRVYLLGTKIDLHARSEFISNRGFEMEYDFAIFPYLRVKRNEIDFDEFLINHTYKVIYTWDNTYKKFFFDEKASNRDNNCRFKMTENKLAFFNDVIDEIAFIHVFGEELKDVLLNPPDENTKKALMKYLLLVDKEVISKR